MDDSRCKKEHFNFFNLQSTFQLDAIGDRGQLIKSVRLFYIVFYKALTCPGNVNLSANQRCPLIGEFNVLYFCVYHEIYSERETCKMKNMFSFQVKVFQ